MERITIKTGAPVEGKDFYGRKRVENIISRFAGNMYRG